MKAELRILSIKLSAINKFPLKKRSSQHVINEHLPGKLRWQSSATSTWSKADGAE
jgi:hypothetical protein